MKNIVKFLDEETDEYSYTFNDFKDINTEYFYSIVLILPKLPFTKDVSEYYNYFALRKAKGYDTIGQCRIAFRSAKYIVHSGTKGRGVKGAGTLPHCELDSKTKSDLIEYLKTGGWVEILEKFNSVMRQLLGDSSYNFYCEMPDYSTLSCDPKFKKR